MRKSFLVVGPLLIIAALTGRGIMGSFGTDPIRAQFVHAEALYHEGNIKEATSEMENALKRDPRRAEIRDALGALYQMQDRPADELKLYNEGIRLAPNDTRMHYSLGMAQYANRRYPEAIEQIKDCLRIGPYHPQYSHLLGMCYERSGQLDEAFRYWTRESKDHPEDDIIKRGLRRVQKKLTSKPALSNPTTKPHRDAPASTPDKTPNPSRPTFGAFQSAGGGSGTSSPRLP